MLVALDFESEAIANRPDYPPTPVGLAIYNGTDAEYMAWGHPTENNCLRNDAWLRLNDLLSDPSLEFIFHNAPFDCSIIEEKMSIQVPWDRVHDTMLLAFLSDPFGELSLKPLCEKLLGMPPEERDAVREWLVARGICRANDKSWGAYISKAPGNLVGEYAKGDVLRTYKLFEYYQSGGLSSQEQRMHVTKPGPVVINTRPMSTSGEAPW
jgi:DNA polymerase I-like protein with 3'-5' exonuclease and polymerase domains